MHHMFTDAFIRHYLWDDRMVTTEEVEEIISLNDRFFDDHCWGLWRLSLLATDQDIGFCGLWRFEAGPPQYLYGLWPEYTGQGFIIEALEIINNYALNDLNIKTLRAICDVDNTASIKVCLRMHMKLSGKDNQGRLIFVKEKNI